MSLTPSIFNMFGRSPIKPLEQHIVKAHACVEQLVPFFQLVIQHDWEKAEQLQLKINNLEKEADEIKTDLRLHLPNGLFMPVSRSDVLDLIALQDALANITRDIVGVVIGRQLKLPEYIADDFMNFLHTCIDTSKQARKAINELDELLETGFRGTEVNIVEDMIHQLDALEHKTDEQQVIVRKKLFANEATLSPIDVMFLYKIIHWTGELANIAQSIGSRLLILIAR